MRMQLIQSERPSDAFGMAGGIWISTAIADQRFPEHPGSSFVIYDSPTASIQESNAWYYNGRWYVLCNAGGGNVLQWATNPRKQWTRTAATLGGGGSLDSGGCTHPSLYIEGTNLYLYYINGTGGTLVKCAVSTMQRMEQLALGQITATAAWTSVVTVLNRASLAGTVAQFGNFSMTTQGVNYILYVEATVATGGDSWVTHAFVSNSPTGTFVSKSGQIVSLHPSFTYGFSQDQSVPAGITNNVFDGYRSNASIGQIFKENGKLVTIYHSSPSISSGDGVSYTDIFRATSPENDGINWTVDNGGWPIYSRRDNRYELDQVADPSIAVGPNGICWAFWTGVSNSNSKFVVKCGPMSPTMKMFDGSDWVAIDQQGALNSGGTVSRQLFHRSRYAIQGIPIFPFESVPVDPGATADFPITLPTAFPGNEVEICNVATTGTYGTSTTANTGTVLVSALAGEVIFGTNAAIAPGQAVRYICRKLKVWCRVG